MNIIKTRSTHSSKLERWLGADGVADLSGMVANWYGPPIAVANVPGAVYACNGGEFMGPLAAGRFSSMADLQYERIKRALRLAAQADKYTLNAGFSSLSNMISQWTQNNKGQSLTFMKNASANAATIRGSSLWPVAGTPGAGAVGGAAPGGTVHAKGDAGSYPIINTVTGSETLSLVSGFVYASAHPCTYVLYDRLFSCTKTMSSSASQAVTGVPTRYTSTTSTDWNYAGGNFMFPECTTTLSATAHNWTVMQYTNQAGVTASVCPSTAGVSGCAQHLFDLAAGTWFMPLAANDIGLTALTQMQCSSNAVTGAVSWVVGHPLALMPTTAANVLSPQDFTNSAFGLTRLYDTACLALHTRQGQASTYLATVSVNLLIG